jgi:hypothetical protein
MKKLLIALAVLAFSVPVYGRVLDLWVGTGTGTPDSYDQDPGDVYIETCVEVDGDLDLDGILWLSDGTVLLPSFTFNGDTDLDSGFYLIGEDNIGITINGAYVGDWSATGFAATGLDGPIGLVAPAAAVFTTVQGTDATFTGDFQFGQTPADLFLGYKDRSDYITYTNTFDEGTDTELADQWDIATLIVGGGSTVTELTTDGWVTLATGGAGGPDSAGIRTNGLNHYRAYAPKIETVVDLGAVAAGQTFYFGFYAGANDYVEIIHEPATSPNWLLRNDDTAGAETEDSGVAATTDPTKLELMIETDGTIHWAIDDVAMSEVGITNQMTAAAHYVRAYLLDVAAAAHTAEIDYYQSEQLKQQ